MDNKDNKVNGNKEDVVFEGRKLHQVDLEKALASGVGYYGHRCPGDQKSTSYVRRVGNGKQKSGGCTSLG